VNFVEFVASRNGQEFVTVIGGTIVIAIVLTFLASLVEPVLRWLENILTYVATAVIIFAMFYVCSEVVARYVFSSPLQGHLEGAELLIPLIVFFATSYTQARGGHVGMSLVVDTVPPSVARWMEVFTLVLSMLICSLLAYFGFKYSFQLWEYDDVTMSPPYFKTWPSAAAIVLGYGMLATRMWLQALHEIAPSRFPASPEDADTGMHAPD
jgi:TRAP-type C4-dicarboxylate transport system permease small subunit